MKDMPLSSGSVLGFQIAPFEDGIKLTNVVFKELIGVPFGQGTGFDLSSLFQMDASNIKDIVLKVGTSEQVQEAIKKCMFSCTYKGVKDFNATRITNLTFEPEHNRGDYFLVAWEVATLNIVPFFANLVSKSSIPSGIITGNEQK